MKCSICNNKIDGRIFHDTAYGHNAQPINNGRCCWNCNYEYVIPARLKQLKQE